MSDPRRWLDRQSDAPEGARALLEHARRTPPADKAALTASALALAKLTSAPAGAAALAACAKLAAAASIVAIAGASALHIATAPPRTPSSASPSRAAQHARPAPDPRSASTLASTPRMPARLASGSGSGPGPGSGSGSAAPARAHASARAPALAPTPTPAPPLAPTPDPDPLALEVDLLDQARALLERDPAAALARADAHAARFPAAALAAERELIAVDALQRLGRIAPARVRADALLQSYPGSLYRARLTSLLAREPR